MGAKSFCEGCGAEISSEGGFCEACGRSVGDDPAAPAAAVDEFHGIGSTTAFPEVSGYRIEDLLARGGMGEVYSAMQLRLDRRVALKLIAPELGSSIEFRSRFEREARIAASIDHPNILPVYEAGETSDGRLFLSMRLSTGEDLDAYLTKSGPMALDDAWPILEQVGSAIDYAHSCGLIHRDIKPRNVLLEERGDGNVRAYLTDFGLARLSSSDSEHTATGEILGTVNYMAPEQIEGGKIDQSVDMYAFGCLMYRVLSGNVLFPRDTKRETLAAHVSAAPPRLSDQVPGIYPSVDVALAQLLSKDPDDRGASIVSVLGAASAGAGEDAETLIMNSPAVGERRLRLEVAWRLPLFAALFTLGYLGGTAV
jgi:serine/threonine-protein kinase